jgi:hypothetical protein
MRWLLLVLLVGSSVGERGGYSRRGPNLPIGRGSLAMLRCAALLMLASLGCVPPNARQTTEGLRTQNGVCAQKNAGFSTTIRACARNGSFQTLHDDPAMGYLVVTTAGLGIEVANPGNWRFTVLRDGQPYFQAMGARRVPSFQVGRYSTTWTGLDVLAMPEPWQQGVYTVEAVCSFDTTVETKMTITIADRPARDGPARAAATAPSVAPGLVDATVTQTPTNGTKTPTLPHAASCEDHCMRDGLCALVDGKCAAASDADCRNSKACTLAGRCRLGDAKCVR